MGLAYLFLTALAALVILGSLMAALELLGPARRREGYALARGLAVDPGELGLAFREIDFVLGDGARTTGWGIAGRAPHGPVFVVSHGWGECRHDVLPRLGPIVELASRIIVYDLRGHGQSTARLCRLGTREEIDLLAILDQLDGDESSAASNERRYVLLGYSMGAGVSIGAAARDGGQRVRAVVAEGPCRTMPRAVAATLRLMKLPAYPMAHLAVALAWPLAPGVMTLDRAAQARRLDCPLLVLRGGDDPVCRPACARAIAASVDFGLRRAQSSRRAELGAEAAAPGRGTLVEFPGGEHLDLARCDQARYLAAIKSILEPRREAEHEPGGAH